MTRNLPVSILAAAALLSGSAAFAATKTVAKTTTKTAKPAKPAPAGARMVTTKTSTGKTITYNCAKAGNAGKAACKK